MLQELRQEGFAATEAALIHNPVGLDIGAENPEQIALAILAEIQAVISGHAGARSARRKVPFTPPPCERRSPRLLELPRRRAERPDDFSGGRLHRLGQPKQLLLFRGAQPLAARRRDGAGVSVPPGVVVLGAYAERLERELSGLPVTVAMNPQWNEGMSSSIRAGLKALAAESAAPDGNAPAPAETPTTKGGASCQGTHKNFPKTLNAYVTRGRR